MIPEQCPRCGRATVHDQDVCAHCGFRFDGADTPAPIEVEARVVRRERREAGFGDTDVDARGVIVHYERADNGGCCCAFVIGATLLFLVLVARGCLSFL